MVDLLNNLDTSIVGTIGTDFTLFFIVFLLVELHDAIGELDLGDLEVVLVLTGGVCAEEETMLGIGPSCRSEEASPASQPSKEQRTDNGQLDLAPGAALLHLFLNATPTHCS
jgi:hypothetical protein